MLNSFHNLSIKDALSTSDETFSLFLPTINQISDDIKAVEKYLKSKDLSLEFELKIHKYFIDDEDVNPNFCTSFQYLKWGAYKDQGYRLLLRETEENDNYGVIEKAFEKPLIECSLQDRANAYKYMDKFIKEFSLEVKSIFDGYLSIEEEES